MKEGREGERGERECVKTDGEFVVILFIPYSTQQIR